jgi:hypothetical protein
MSLPLDAKERKEIPVYSGCIKYFPDALAAVAKLSKKGNDQHNPGKELHWDRSKSGDELDAMMRHVLDEDWDAVAWRALANLQKQIEDSDAIDEEYRHAEAAVAADGDFKTENPKNSRPQTDVHAELAPTGQAWNIIDKAGRLVGIIPGDKARSAGEAWVEYSKRWKTALGAEQGENA